MVDHKRNSSSIELMVYHKESVPGQLSHSLSHHRNVSHVYSFNRLLHNFYRQSCRTIDTASMTQTFGQKSLMIVCVLVIVMMELTWILMKAPTDRRVFKAHDVASGVIAEEVAERVVHLVQHQLLRENKTSNGTQLINLSRKYIYKAVVILLYL